MKLPMDPGFRWLAACVLVSGCAHPRVPPVLAPAHPAHPQAASSPIPPLETGLLGITNINVENPGRKRPEPAHPHDQP